LNKVSARHCDELPGGEEATDQRELIDTIKNKNTSSIIPTLQDKDDDVELA